MGVVDGVKFRVEVVKGEEVEFLKVIELLVVIERFCF